MTSVSGHLMTHEVETKYRKWYSCAPAQLFDVPVSKICPTESANNIKRTLEKEVRKKLRYKNSKFDQEILLIALNVGIFPTFVYSRLQIRSNHWNKRNPNLRYERTLLRRCQKDNFVFSTTLNFGNW